MSGLHLESLQLNISIDTAKGTIDPALVAHYTEYAHRTQLTIAERFKAADRSWSNGLGDGLCRGAPVTPQLETLATIKPLGTFLFYHTSGRFGPGSMDGYIREWRHNRRTLQFLHSGRLTGDRNHIWLTYATPLLSEIEHEPSRADAARAVLGLSHMPNSVELIALLFPLEYFSVAAIPTFIDGGANEAFCVWNDDHLGHGFTWRLDHQIKGLPEIVCQNVRLDARAVVELLGKTSSVSVFVDFAKLLRRFPGP